MVVVKSAMAYLAPPGPAASRRCSATAKLAQPIADRNRREGPENSALQPRFQPLVSGAPRTPGPAPRDALTIARPGAQPGLFHGTNWQKVIHRPLTSGASLVISSRNLALTEGEC